MPEIDQKEFKEYSSDDSYDVWFEGDDIIKLWESHFQIGNALHFSSKANRCKLGQYVFGRIWKQ